MVYGTSDPEYEVKLLEGGTYVASCIRGFNEYGYLHCDGTSGIFKMNKSNGRYIRSNTLGFVNVLPDAYGNLNDNTSDDPYVEIGKCTSF